MVDFNKILDDLDLSAVVLLNDQLNECNFFYELLQKEPDRDRFGWLFGAFLNSCYGYLDITTTKVITGKSIKLGKLPIVSARCAFLRDIR